MVPVDDYTLSNEEVLQRLRTLVDRGDVPGFSDGGTGGNAPSAPIDRSEILLTANELVTHDRNALHGEPEENHENIAEFWNVFLSQHFQFTFPPLQPWHVATMMMLMKVARFIHNPRHTDSVVDLVGYAAIAGELAEGEVDE